MINQDYIKARRETASRLQREFPSLVGHLDWSAIFRFGPDPGWESLIRETLAAMLELDPNIQIYKIRNKLGECDIVPITKSNVHPCRLEIRKLYNDARRKSRNICLWCGNTKNVSTDVVKHRQIATLCSDCWKIFNIDE